MRERLYPWSARQPLRIARGCGGGLCAAGDTATRGVGVHAPRRLRRCAEVVWRPSGTKAHVSPTCAPQAARAPALRARRARLRSSQRSRARSGCANGGASRPGQAAAGADPRCGQRYRPACRRARGALSEGHRGGARPVPGHAARRTAARWLGTQAARLGAPGPAPAGMRRHRADAAGARQRGARSAPTSRCLGSADWTRRCRNSTGCWRAAACSCSLRWVPTA